MKILLKILFPLWLVGSLMGEDPAPAAPEPPEPAVMESESGGIIVRPLNSRAEETPVFFTAISSSAANVTRKQIDQGIDLTLRVLQGKAKVLSLELRGQGKVQSVTNVKSWAVRTVGETRFLDLHIAEDTKEKDHQMKILTVTELEKIPATLELLTLAPGSAASFSSSVKVKEITGIGVKATKVPGFMKMEQPAGEKQLAFQSLTGGQVFLEVSGFGGVIADAVLENARLEGRLAEDGDTVEMTLEGTAVIREAGATLDVLFGKAGLRAYPESTDYQMKLQNDHYKLVFPEPGTFPVSIAFDAMVARSQDRHSLEFRVPSGSIVPITLSGLKEGVAFDASGEVAPQKQDSQWRGFLPASGWCRMAWKPKTRADEGSLFFTCDGVADIRVGAGLLRQDLDLKMKVLQGRLRKIEFALAGEGRVLSVAGKAVLSWKVTGEKLEVLLNRPIENELALSVQSRTELGKFPVTVEPLRITPEGALRYSGMNRISNIGSVKLELASVTGMTQLSPEQFAGGAKLPKGTRQIFVYRVPAAEYSYELVADTVLPEVSVSQIVIYELNDTGRMIRANVELDIREAPLREFVMTVPEGYLVASVTGANVVDHVSGDDGGPLRIQFGSAVMNRQLLEVQMEKNDPAGAGNWVLPRIDYPGSRDVRGHLGLVAPPGFRVAAAATDKLTEIPAAHFPNQVKRLQQSFRLREREWSAELQIEALGQNVQADVFHLYSLKEGVAYGSILLNYFVVGAPVSQWEIEMGEGPGNVSVDGEYVRGWRREGTRVIVDLNQPVLDAHTLLITFEQPMSGEDAKIYPGSVTPLGVQTERGYVQITSPQQVRFEAKDVSENLIYLEALELPAELRVLSQASSLAVYQYSARPFALEMDFEWFEPSETVDQVVDFANFSTRIAKDGQTITDAQFFVKSRGRKALRMLMPSDVQLWEVKVGGQAVSARADGAHTIIPLPADRDANTAVEVGMRFGGQAPVAKRLTLRAPKLETSALILDWHVDADRGRQLVPVGGIAESGTTQSGSGFERLRLKKNSVLVWSSIGLVVVGFVFRYLGRKNLRGCKVLAKCCFAATALVLVLGGFVDFGSHEPARASLDLVAPIVTMGEEVNVDLKNLQPWQLMISWGGVVLIALGLIIVSLPKIRRWEYRELGLTAGWLCFSMGLLFQGFGASLFLIWLGLFVGWYLVFSGIKLHSSKVTALALLGCIVFSAQDADAKKAPVPEWLAADAYSEHWEIREKRLYARVDVRVQGEAGDAFLLLKSPAVLTSFEGEGLEVTRHRDQYLLVAKREGVLEGTLTYELGITDLSKPFALPTGMAAMHRIQVSIDEPGWDFVSPAAVRIDSEDEAKKSTATLLLGSGKGRKIRLKPRARDVDAEEVEFYTEITNLYLPRPGVVDGYHRVKVRPSQGRVRDLEFIVPEGFMVSDVKGAVSLWRFDPNQKRLRVTLEAAPAKEFILTVGTQSGLAALPAEIGLAALQVVGSAGETGRIAIGFGADARAGKLVESDVSRVQSEDFQIGAFFPKKKKAPSLPQVRHVFRYGAGGGSVQLTVLPMEPEVRGAIVERISIGGDRVTLAADLTVNILRAGIFKLSFPLPEGFEVESLSGGALSQWTESTVDAQRIITMHMNGRTLGEQKFALTLVSPGLGSLKAWEVPKIDVLEATRQSGNLFVVPEQGIRLQPVNRRNVSLLDARQEGANQPGALAFRLLQPDWGLSLDVEELDPWLTVSVLHEATLREGRTHTRVFANYKVENASVKALRVVLPGGITDANSGVRATGTAVSDMVPVEGEPGTWEIQFRRRMIGEVPIEIEYHRQADRAQGAETFAPLIFPDTRQATYYMALYGAGRLELSRGNEAKGWRNAGWRAVPEKLRQRLGQKMPNLCLRVIEPEEPLVVNVVRHEVADTIRLRVSKSHLTTVFSSRGSLITEIAMEMEVVEKSTLRLRLPQGAILYNAFVNSESVGVVQDGEDYLLPVAPNPIEESPANVSLVYAVNGEGSDRGTHLHLLAPQLSVPLENMTWDVVIPEGYEMTKYEGELELRKESGYVGFSLDQYLASSKTSKEAQKKQAEAWLSKANSYLQNGRQVEARGVFNQVANSGMLDAASNEDARVQLNELVTDQAMLGLHSRRQKLSIDNGFDVSEEEMDVMQQRAASNPLYNNDVNWSQDQMDAILAGNRKEENVVLHRLANRLIQHQLSAEQAPEGLTILLPKRGRTLTFTRNVQLDGNKPIFLDLNVVRKDGAFWGPLLIMMAVIVWIIGVCLIGRRAFAG